MKHEIQILTDFIKRMDKALPSVCALSSQVGPTTQNSICVAQVGSKYQSIGTIICCLTGCDLGGNLNWKQIRKWSRLKPRQSDRGFGCSNHHLSAGSNSHLCYFFLGSLSFLFLYSCECVGIFFSSKKSSYMPIHPH